ncbi:MAG: MOSC domain-containing protein [Pirellula sp.]|nr:MOSC domain-containing protein [Pirellula sp.]
MPRLVRITIYPIKSLDGALVDSAVVSGIGGLENDRRFALRDAQGNLVNAKRHASIHAIRASFDLAEQNVSLSAPDRTAATFSLSAGNAELEAWCSDFFGFSVTLEENIETGFPDDLESPGPTVISRATLLTVADWFGNFDLQEARRRFRANLEIDSLTPIADADDCPPFWEDRLFAADAAPDARETVRFHIGDATFEGVNPCARCVVPSRDSQTGEISPRFAVEFARRRRETLPGWVEPSAFNHFYRLSVNTRASAALGRTLCVGDEVRLG